MTEYTPLTLVVAALRHVVRQGVPAAQFEAGCVTCEYIDRHGNRCAIGGLLPKHMDRSETRHFSLANALKQIIGRDLDRNDPLFEAAASAQVIHDKWAGADRPPRIFARAINDLDRYATGWREELGEDYQKLLDLTGLDLSPRAI